MKVIDFGTALNFDGIDDAITILNASSNNPTTAITLAAWVKTTDFGAVERGVISKWHTSYNWGLYTNNVDKKYRFAIGKNPTGEAYADTPTSSIRVGEWQFLTATYDGANMKIYIDAVLQVTTATTGNLRTGLDVYVGRQASGTYFKGKIDEPRIWKDVALTQQQITNLYSRGEVPQTGLSMQLLLNEGAGTVANDTSSSANNGTILGSAVYTSDVPMRAR